MSFPNLKTYSNLGGSLEDPAEPIYTEFISLQAQSFVMKWKSYCGNNDFNRKDGWSS